MEIKKLPGTFSVCKVEDYSLVDEHTEFCFTGKTEEENSLVCPADKVRPIRRTGKMDGRRSGFRECWTFHLSEYSRTFPESWQKTKSESSSYQPFTPITY